MMRLVCPSCGAIASAEAWANDLKARQCMGVIAEMPVSIATRSLQYIGLFRPPEKGIRWSKALRLLSELAELTKNVHVQWDRKPARPINTNQWGFALEKIVQHPPKHLPLKSHGYLTSIAYDIADDADKQAEQVRNKRRSSKISCSDPQPIGDITVEQMREIRRQAFNKKNMNIQMQEPSRSK